MEGSIVSAGNAVTDRGASLLRLVRVSGASVSIATEALVGGDVDDTSALTIGVARSASAGETNSAGGEVPTSADDWLLALVKPSSDSVPLDSVMLGGGDGAGLARGKVPLVVSGAAVRTGESVVVSGSDCETLLTAPAAVPVVAAKGRAP